MSKEETPQTPPVVEERSLTANIIQAAEVVLPSATLVGLHWWDKRPPKEQPPEIVIPPGVQDDK